MRLLDFADGFTTETEPDQGRIRATHIKQFANDAAYVTDKGSAAAEGDLYANTTDNTIHYFDGSEWISILSDSSSISRSQLAAGSANHVLINDGSGNLSSEASLDETRGGTAQTTYTAGDLLYASGANTLSKLAIGTSNQVLTVTGGVPAWEDQGTGSKILNVRSVTSTDTATTNDDLILLSGASFTQTLFTAVGNEGHVLEIVHNGTSITQAYTIEGHSSETIGGSANVALNVNGEVLRIVSDGSNWIVLDHRLNDDSEVYVHTSNGYGSTNDKILRFTTEVVNKGALITYADSSTAGGSFTANKKGLYSISIGGGESAAGSTVWGVSKNSNALTTAIDSIDREDALLLCQSAAANRTQLMAGVFELASGDIVRSHGDGSTPTSDSETFFNIKFIRPLL